MKMLFIICHKYSNFLSIHHCLEDMNTIKLLNKVIFCFINQIEVFELEKSLFSKKLFELFHNLTRASFILWFIECVRELIMTHLRRQRFTIREKLNTIIRVCLCVTTFPSFRPYFLGKQKYWVFFGKVLLLFHSIFQYYYFHKGMEYYFTVYILEKDTEFIENLEKKDN